MRARVLLCTGVSLTLAFAGCSSDEPPPAELPVSLPTVLQIATTTETPVALSVDVIGPSGGVISSGELPGLRIEVPEGAASEDVRFEVHVQTIESISGLPEGVVRASERIIIEAAGSADWNQFRVFDLPVLVTLPFDVEVPGPDTVRFYVHQADGTLEPTGFEQVDLPGGTVTFATRTFADTAEEPELPATGLPLLTHARRSPYIALGLGTLWVSKWLTNGVDLDTAFRPARDGWFIPNYGAYHRPSRGGNCMGMVTWSKYWFRKHGAGFHEKYRDAANTETWLDDETAIELASRAHGAEMDIWNNYLTKELKSQTGSARAVALSWLGGLYITKQPVFAGIYQATRNADGTLKKRGGHAIMIYRAVVDGDGKVDFQVYDPNHPRKENRKIAYHDGIGFYVYRAGTSAASPGRPYNYFQHFGYHVAVSDALFDNLKRAADAGFAADSVFPKVTITSITSKSTYEDVMSQAMTTPQGEKGLFTDDSAVIIRGTVLGGYAQRAGSVVNNINIIVADRLYATGVDNAAGSGTGQFEVTVPLYQGRNQVVFLASKRNKFSHWAAFDREIIESRASRADLTVTLSWGQGSSDVDLYVREPSFAGASGDTVYYQHRKGASAANPYLDIDNTSGYGPEHYYAKQGTASLGAGGETNPDGLYGHYDVRAHYYADHDEDPDATQPVSWSVDYRFLAFCPAPCDNPESDGFWEQGTWRGHLTAADGSGGCCNIDNAGAPWSSMMSFEYPKPNPDDYAVPDPPSIQLP